jgi:NADH dehydrogenase
VSADRPRIVVAGGGYVAIGATRALRRSIRRGEVHVTVVSRENFHFFHGLVADCIVGRMSPTSGLSPVRRIFPPADFRMAEVEEIDLAARTVAGVRAVDGLRCTFEYDHLLIGIGSVDHLELYPGLGEHAFRLKTAHDVLGLRNHVIAMFELAEIESDPLERRRLLTFVVAGGGYAGTEVAAELADFVGRLSNGEYSSIRRKECRVVLVQPGPTILPELYGSKGGPGHAEGHPRLVEFATKHVRSIGVEVLTGTRVTSVSPNEVALSEGESIRAGTIISAVGARPSPIVGELDLPKDEHGRLRTDPFLRVEGQTNVWAGGDCAAVPHPDGGTCPPRALDALQHGRFAARNILASTAGRSLRRYTYRAFGQGIPIGRHVAVAELKGRELHGTLSWFLLRAFLLYYTPTWDRRVRLFADWLATPFVGRDIVESGGSSTEPYELRENVYGPNELIVREGRPGRYLHVILEGEVQLVRAGAGGDEVFARLGAGDMFGQKWLDQTAEESARAVTQVRTLMLRADQARRARHLLAALAKLNVAGA